MKFLKIFLILIILILAGFSIWNATLPSTYDFNRSIEIEAPAERIFNQVNNVKNWESWSPWAAMDNTAEFTYDEKTEGMDAWYSWVGDTVGTGKLTIVESTPYSEIKTKLEFTEPNATTSSGYWRFEESDGVTTVTWGNTGELPFLMRFIGPVLEDQLGDTFEEGLSSLKTEVESSSASNSFEHGQIDIVEAEGGTYVGKKYVDLPWSEMESAYGNGYAEIYEALGMDAKNITGAPFGEILTWDEENQMTTLVVGIPVETDLEIAEPLEKGQMYSGRAVRYAHYGPYELTGEAHMAIEEYVNNNGLTFSGAPWESYVTDPGMEPDSSKWLTLVYYPIQ